MSNYEILLSRDNHKRTYVHLLDYDAGLILGTPVSQDNDWAVDVKILPSLHENVPPHLMSEMRDKLYRIGACNVGQCRGEFIGIDWTFVRDCIRVLSTAHNPKPWHLPLPCCGQQRNLLFRMASYYRSPLNTREAGEYWEDQVGIDLTIHPAVYGSSGSTGISGWESNW